MSVEYDTYQLRPKRIVRGRDINDALSFLDGLYQLQVTWAQAQDNGNGTFNYEGSLKVSDTNVILELIAPPQVTAAAPGGAANIAPMQIQSWTTTNDYFSAKAYSFTGGATGSAVNVAIPWKLRSAQSPGGVSPIIYPPYIANDIVMVLTTAAGQNGVTVSGAELTLLALNDSRAWAQRVSYSNAACTAVHRWVVGGLEIAGA